MAETAPLLAMGIMLNLVVQAEVRPQITNLLLGLEVHLFLEELVEEGVEV